MFLDNLSSTYLRWFAS